MTGSRAIDVVGDSMRMRVLPCEKTGTGWRAQRCCHESIPKDDAFFANAIDVGRFDVWMSRNAQLIPPQIIYENEDDVGSRLHNDRATLAEAGYRQDQQEGEQENAESRADALIRQRRPGEVGFAQCFSGSGFPKPVSARSIIDQTLESPNEAEKPARDQLEPQLRLTRRATQAEVNERGQTILVSDPAVVNRTTTLRSLAARKNGSPPR